MRKILMPLRKYSHCSEKFSIAMKKSVFKYIVFLNRVLKENRSKILIIEKVTTPLKDSNLLFFS